MSVRITVTELARNLADTINRVVYRGERFVLLRGQRPVAELRPLPKAGRLGELPALMEALPGLGSDEAALLEADLEEARTDLDGSPQRDPWAS